MRAPIDREGVVDLRIDPPAAGNRRAHARRKLDTAPLPEFEERIGTGSVIDFLCSPFVALFAWWTGGGYAPNPADRRELWLSLGFYGIVAAIAIAKVLL